MRSVKPYFVLLLLICYGITFHVVPAVHYHQIKCDAPEQVNEYQHHTKGFADSDGSVCLICSRLESTHSFNFTFELFQGVLSSEPLYSEDSTSPLSFSEFTSSTPRAPPVV